MAGGENPDGPIKLGPAVQVQFIDLLVTDPLDLEHRDTGLTVLWIEGVLASQDTVVGFELFAADSTATPTKRGGAMA